MSAQPYKEGKCFPLFSIIWRRKKEGTFPPQYIASETFQRSPVQIREHLCSVLSIWKGRKFVPCKMLDGQTSKYWGWGVGRRFAIVCQQSNYAQPRKALRNIFSMAKHYNEGENLTRDCRADHVMYSSTFSFNFMI